MSERENDIKPGTRAAEGNVRAFVMSGRDVELTFDHPDGHGFPAMMVMTLEEARRAYVVLGRILNAKHETPAPPTEGTHVWMRGPSRTSGVVIRVDADGVTVDFLSVNSGGDGRASLRGTIIYTVEDFWQLWQTTFPGI